jgi:hypothetical protein
MTTLVTGLAAAGASVVLFGVFPFPTRTSPTGNGIAFQFFMCLGISAAGTAAYAVQCVLGATCPQFIPLASAGGALWALSNLLLVPIVDCIGVGQHGAQSREDELRCTE